MRTAIVAMALAGAALVASAQPLSVSVIVERLQSRLAPAFSLEKLPPLDPELRREGEALAHEHLVRMKTVLARWVADEQARLKRDRPSWDQLNQGAAWVINEIATWRVESLGPEDDGLRRRMMTAPGICRHFDDLSHFGYQLVQIQTLPEADRPRALALERERLARWGSPRPALPAWPRPLPDAQLELALAEARRAEGRMTPPMSPALANALVRDPNKSPLAGDALRCETVRWWLLRAGDAPGALELARLALMPKPPVSVAESNRDTGSSYPAVAVRYGVVGSTTVQMEFDAQGKAVDPRVQQRAVTVPGLQDQRPIAFETAFDAVSLARVRTMTFAGRPGQSHTLEFVWKLE